MAVVKLPVAGKVDQKVVLAGGAAVVGIVGYAWLSRGGGSSPDDEVGPVADLPVTEYEPPTVVNSNGSFGGTTPTTIPGAAQSNTEWITQAYEQGARIGGSDTLINSAVSKYLAKQRLTSSEWLLITAIVAIIGTPPSGGPYTILAASPEPPSGGGEHEAEKLPAPTGFNPTGTTPYTVILQWHRVAGAVSYEVRRDDQGPWINVGPVERIEVPAPQDQQNHKYAVRAVNSGGHPGFEATGQAHTISSTQFNQNLVTLQKSGYKP